jgi:hypothetical protein
MRSGYKMVEDKLAKPLGVRLAPVGAFTLSPVGVPPIVPDPQSRFTITP